MTVQELYKGSLCIFSCLLVYSHIWIVEDDRICQGSSRLLPEISNLLLTSISDMQKTGKRRTIFRHVRELSSSI
jgi:hypothetical protein